VILGIGFGSRITVSTEGNFSGYRTAAQGLQTFHDEDVISIRWLQNAKSDKDGSAEQLHRKIDDQPINIPERCQTNFVSRFAMT